MIGAEEPGPVDRPNLSKDYLAGSAPEGWIPLRPPDFYEKNGITRSFGRVARVHPGSARIELTSGESLPYGALLLATGSAPLKLRVPGADGEHVHTLRSFADCRRIIQGASAAEKVVIAGASFIGMEAAASLRARGLQVTVVAPDEVPFERTLGREVGMLLLDEHRNHEVAFRLGRTIERVETDYVVLSDGSFLPADLVVVGIGVRPETSIAEAAGLAVDDGILVDDHLRTSDSRIYAAGDIARWMDPRTGRRVRIEHWVVAQRQGQAAARNILGREEPYRDVP
jgi:NADPH-dependent 2,4-dienoyl-CoA reductase/sulfur reductase-like enzyme